jgi:hypothetical protein
MTKKFTKDHIGKDMEWEGVRFANEKPDPAPTREEVIAAGFEKWCLGNADRLGKLSAHEAFTSGFESGAQLGYADGFRKGGEITGKQLTSPISGKPMVQGNQLVTPSTKLEAIREDQLTAEICELVHRYAILPSEVRVRALIEAARSMGVEITLK